MGVSCKICVNQSCNASAVVKAGSDVNGTIKYAFDDKTSVKRIYVSFIGYGRSEVAEKSGSGEDETTKRYSQEHQIANIDMVVLCDDQGKVFPIGAYETHFNFKIPKNIPSSLRYKKSDRSHDIKCKIKYLIQIKFEFTSLFKFNKTFQNEIRVESGIIPRLPLEPRIYGDKKNLFQLFGTKENSISLKACIQRSVINPGGKIDIRFDLINNSSKTICGIKKKLVEVHTFHKKANGSSPVIKYENVEGTKTRNAEVKSGKTVSIPYVFNVPPHLRSLAYAKIVERDYQVVITVELPAPHRDIELRIPVQIGYILGDGDQNDYKHAYLSSPSTANAATNIPGPSDTSKSGALKDSPPSYWEAMTDCTDKIPDK